MDIHKAIAELRNERDLIERQSVRSKYWMSRDGPPEGGPIIQLRNAGSVCLRSCPIPWEQTANTSQATDITLYGQNRNVA